MGGRAKSQGRGGLGRGGTGIESRPELIGVGSEEHGGSAIYDENVGREADD